MGLDYYEVLGLTRSCSADDIKDSYRRLALLYHPDKCPYDESAARIFSRVCESYDVLSNPELKACYDMYGEIGLKSGVVDKTGAMIGGLYEWTDEKGEEVFGRFFGTENPFQALHDMRSIFHTMTAKAPTTTGTTVMLDVECTLEDIYHGCIKTIKHTKKVVKGDGSVEQRVVPLQITVKAGCKTGTRFVFKDAGDEAPNVDPGMVICLLREKEHDVFSRDGQDLVYEATLPLYKALAGTAIDVTTLDGRLLTCPLPTIIQPGCERVIEGEGFPCVEGGGKRGSLRIIFELLFPTNLNDTQRMLLKSAFYYPHHPTPPQQKAVKAYLKAFRDEVHGWTNGFPQGS